MKTAIITCFESNEERMSLVYDAMKDAGHEVIALTSDFSHIRKAHRDEVPERFTAISTRPYSRNLSLARIRSHMVFARDAFSYIEDKGIELIWLMAPANSLIYQAERYRRKHPETRLIIDIIDMWPESLPVSLPKTLLPFRIWKGLRKRHLDCADLVVTECDMYRQILKDEYHGRLKTIRWAKERNPYRKPQTDDERVSLCYIGSINNIIDPDLMARLIAGIDRRCLVHVIGEGENTALFLEKLQAVADVEYHGPIRDEEKKAEIFSRCHAGLNIYREGLYIGLTVKCLDYFGNGLPIINNIKGDTWKLVEGYGAGFNVTEDTRLSGSEIIERRSQSDQILKMYDGLFTRDVFIKTVQEALDEVAS